MSSRGALHTAWERIVVHATQAGREFSEVVPRHCRSEGPMIAAIGKGQKEVNSELEGSPSVSGLCRRESAVRTVVWKVPSSPLYVTPHLLSF